MHSRYMMQFVIARDAGLLDGDPWTQFAKRTEIIPETLS